MIYSICGLINSLSFVFDTPAKNTLKGTITSNILLKDLKITTVFFTWEARIVEVAPMQYVGYIYEFYLCMIHEGQCYRSPLCLSHETRDQISSFS